MQNVEHDMDDLFRKAGENYPLNQGAGNWDKLSAKLQMGKKALPSGKNTKKQKKIYISFLLLLFFLVLSGLFYKYGGLQTAKHLKEKSKESVKARSVSGKNGHRESTSRLQNIKDPVALTPNDDIRKKTISSIRKNHIAVTAPYFQEEKREDKILPPAYAPNRAGQTEGWAQTIFTAQFPTAIPDGAGEKNYSLKFPAPDHAGIIFVEPHREKNKGKTTVRDQGRIYAGMIVGPDFSTVKYQSIPKGGYNFGVIAGYKFQGRLSLETGLLFGEKYYYSIGSYFSTSKIGPSMPAGMELLTVKGKDEVLEIPVQLKYDFAGSPKTKFFGAAGVTSYIILKEKNDYLARYNNSEEHLNGSYNADSYHWLSAINIALGIEKQFGKNGNLRLEPYFKIPVQGIGMGNMHVTSAGINIVIARFLTR